jgi:hypothetical protein
MPAAAFQAAFPPTFNCFSVCGLPPCGQALWGCLLGPATRSSRGPLRPQLLTTPLLVRHAQFAAVFASITEPALQWRADAGQSSVNTTCGTPDLKSNPGHVHGQPNTERMVTAVLSHG